MRYQFTECTETFYIMQGHVGILEDGNPDNSLGLWHPNDGRQNLKEKKKKKKGPRTLWLEQ